MIVIVDYGMGNLRSVANALQLFTSDYKISSEVEDIVNADKLILPGVGAFGDAIKNLDNRGLLDVLKNFIKSGKSFLGICLGLQLLFEESEESPGIEGLGILKGQVKKFQLTDLKVPQIGWNTINIKKKSNIVDDSLDGEYFYFVHSYYVEPKESEIILSTTEYGIEYVSAIEKDNVVAVQFHPEKSHKNGLKIISNFVNQ